MFALTRENAWNILTEHTKGESLRKHALAVEAALRGYARKFGEDEEAWGVVALLHDFDYERYPTLGDHPVKGCDHLKSLGYPEWVTRAILSHAVEATGVQVLTRHGPGEGLVLHALDHGRGLEIEHALAGADQRGGGDKA